MAPYSQENRFLTIDTPLGKDVLLIKGIEGSEGLSRLFGFELDLLSISHDIKFPDIIGKNVTVSLVLADGNKRFVNGLVSRFVQGRGGDEAGGDPYFSRYKATVVPWLWLLSKTSDSRIFQKKSVPEIVQEIFQEKNLLDFQTRLNKSYPVRNYCVQYRETDFNFVSRLLEEEGIFYFFEHEDKKHTLVLADDPNEHKPCPGQPAAKYQLSAGSWLDEDVITALEISRQIRPAKYTLKDFNFEIPSTDLLVNVPTEHELGPGEREVYDYPGRYDKRDEGDRLAKIRMQEEEARITTIEGGSVCRAFAGGYRFDLKNYYRKDFSEKSYVLTYIEHEAGQGFAQDPADGFAYKNSFTCIPFDIPYRPPRVTSRPVVRGSQTAIVVGPKGEEIYTDEYGRVKVQFHWDREGKRDENSSCWIRISQAWAGSGWGAVYIPRIGQEVIVDFLEGDPDRPIITGCVYHGMNMPPYNLPDHKTRSTIKSDSTLGGSGFNELRFEDKKGKEEIFLHGQKDWTISIRNNKDQTVGANETLNVGVNRTKEVGANETEKIGTNQSSEIGANRTEIVGAVKTVTVGTNKSETVRINSAETIGAAKELSIGGLYQVTVGGAMNETVGGAKGEEVGGIKAVLVGSHLSEKIAGNMSVSVSKDMSEVVDNNHSLKAKKVFIEAQDELNLKVGQSSIVLKKNGDIVISGTKLNIKASGDLVLKGSKITQN